MADVYYISVYMQSHSWPNILIAAWNCWHIQGRFSNSFCHNGSTLNIIQQTLLGSIYSQIVMRTDDNILFWFEIPVNDAVFMQMTKSQGQLCQVELHIFFSKHHLPVHDMCVCVTYYTPHITVSRTFTSCHYSSKLLLRHNQQQSFLSLVSAELCAFA